MNTLVEKVVQTLREVLPGKKESYALHEPNFSGNEKQYVLNCVETGWVSSVGQYVNRIEQELERITGIEHAVAVVNGTAALHTCLILGGVQPGDEVLMPALTFVATANAVAYCQATPHFIDVEETSLGIDVDKLSRYLEEITVRRHGECFNKISGKRMKAVIAMHTFGHPVDLDRLVPLCKHYGLILIEDAAESLGSLYKGRHTGGDGLFGVLSFNGNKIVTTGGGGAILTRDQELAQRAKHITTTAKLPHRWEFYHDQIAFNYRMPNINAALGCAQLEQLPQFISHKRNLAESYAQAFGNIDGIRFFREPDYAKSNYWLNALILNDPSLQIRDKILEETNDLGIMTRPIWKLMSDLEMYRHCPKMDLSCAEQLVKRIINIPSSARLGECL